MLFFTIALLCTLFHHLRLHVRRCDWRMDFALFPALQVWLDRLPSDSDADTCRGVVLLNGAGRIEDVQTAVEAPVAAGLSSTEKEVLAAIDPADFSDAGHTASGMTRQDSAFRSESSSQSSASQTAAPLTKSSKEQTSFLQQVLSPLATMAKRVAVYGSFILTKQPSRVKQVLQQVRV